MKTQSNPYESTNDPAVASSDSPVQNSDLKLVLAGVGWAIAATIPIAAILGLLFRFPVPFNGYMSGPSAFFMSMFGVMFYGLVFGGWIVVGILGGLCAWIARIMSANERTARMVSRVSSVAVALAACAVMATLDWIIGPF